jgi:hypothetical protein
VTHFQARNPNYNSTSNSQFTQLQNQVDEVKDVMTNNIDSILKRGDRLEDLVDKTTELESTVNFYVFFLNKIPFLEELNKE